MNNPVRYGPHDKYVEVWGVQSDSNPNKTYVVARTAENIWSCSCPRWTLNASRPECKHIRHIKEFSARNISLPSTTPTEIPAPVKKALSRFSAIEL